MTILAYQSNLRLNKHMKIRKNLKSEKERAFRVMGIEIGPKNLS
jgi:hypothetical protein